jgi:hypothetical protein
LFGIKSVHGLRWLPIKPASPKLVTCAGLGAVSARNARRCVQTMGTPRNRVRFGGRTSAERTSLRAARRRCARRRQGIAFWQVPPEGVGRMAAPGRKARGAATLLHATQMLRPRGRHAPLGAAGVTDTNTASRGARGEYTREGIPRRGRRARGSMRDARDGDFRPLTTCQCLRPRDTVPVTRPRDT